MGLKRNRSKKPKIFWMFYVIAVIIAVALGVFLPWPTPLKIMVGMLAGVAFAFLGIWLYAKYFKR